MSEQWEDRNIDADETCTLDKERGVVEGVYLGTKICTTKLGDSQLHIFEVAATAKGAQYNLGVWGFTHLNQGMASVQIGTPCKLSYAGERDTGMPSPMRLARVQVPQGSPRREIVDTKKCEPVKGELEQGNLKF